MSEQHQHHDSYLGAITFDAEEDLHYTKTFTLPCLDHGTFRFAVEETGEPLPYAAISHAIKTLAEQDASFFHSATDMAIDNCRQCEEGWMLDDDERIELQTPHDIWKHVHLACGYDGEASDIHVSQNHHNDADEAIYFLIEGECEWEPEHGIQVVIRDGKRITRISQYDGHIE